MGFLKESDYDELPEHDHEAFAYLEAISRERLHALESDQFGNYDYLDVMRYMNEVAALAEHFGVPGIPFDAEPDNYQAQYGRFTLAVEYQLAQIRVRRARRHRSQSVELSGPTRERIQHHLERLKNEISAANIPEKRKRSLLDRIADFEVELTKKRFDMVKAMMLFALTAAAANDFTGVLKDAPKLIQSMTAALGAEKVQEEETKQLPRPGPPKALEDKRSVKPPPAAFDDFDEDVPF